MVENENELLNRCRGGDARAWDELFETFYPPLLRFVFQLGFDFTHEDCEEICQEVFVNVVRHLDSFRRHCRFQTWLFQLAINKARDFCQRKNAAKRGGGQVPVSLQAEDLDSAPMDPAASTPSPDLALLQSENLLLVGQSLDQLHPACREIIQLRYFADLSYEEISTALKLNPKTVSSRLSKCLGRLETILRRLFAREKTTPFSV